MEQTKKTDEKLVESPSPRVYATACLRNDDDSYSVSVEFDGIALRASLTNVVISTAEAEAEFWTETFVGSSKPSLQSSRFGFHLKAKSDSNKEALARQLKLAFPNKLLAWPLAVSNLTAGFIKALSERKQLIRLSEVDDSPKEWLLEPFIMEGSINTLFGLGGSGKTLLAMYFASLLVSGKKLDGKDGKQGNVMLIDYENDDKDWRDSVLKLFGGGPAIDLEELDKRFVYWNTEQIPLAEQVNKIKQDIRENDIKLVIVDSASRASGDSTSDEAAALRLVGALKLIGVTVLLIAHERKNNGEDTPIGSVQYHNQSRVVWRLKTERDDSSDSILHIACQHTKANGSYLRKIPECFKVTFGQGYTRIENEPARNYFDSDVPIKERILVELSAGGGVKSAQDIADNLGVSLSIVKPWLSRLKGRKLISNNAGGNWYLTSTYIDENTDK